MTTPPRPRATAPATLLIRLLALGTARSAAAGAAFRSPSRKDVAAAAPFTITDDSFSDAGATVHLKVLTNTATGESASVSTNFGGGVESLALNSPRTATPRDVLWTHGRNASAVKLNADWRGRMLIPYGNRIGGAQYSFNGSVFHLPVNDVAGLNNSLHGLIWDRPLAVVASEAGVRRAAVTLRYDFDGADPGYPFHLRTEITYSLVASIGNQSVLDIKVDFTNLDPQGWPLPVYNGWHPYLLCNAAASSVVLDTCTNWTHVDVGMGPQFPAPRYSNMVPTRHVTPLGAHTIAIGGNATDPTYMDDEVAALSPEKCEGSFETRLHDGLTGDVTVLEHESRFLQIWTGAMATFGVDAVVLEPLSAMSDGFNNHAGLHVLSAGERFSNSFGIRLE